MEFMNIALLIGGFILYVVGAVLAYRLLRADYRRGGGTWTFGARNTTLMVAVVPLVGLLVGISMWLDSKSNEEALW